MQSIAHESSDPSSKIIPCMSLDGSKSSLQVSQTPDDQVPFLGFSRKDQKLMAFMKAGIRQINGNLSDKFISQPFQKIPKNHFLYQAILNVIDCMPTLRIPSLSIVPLKNPFIISKLINYIYHYTRKELSESCSNDAVIYWPNPVSDAAIIGSKIWELLKKERELLREGVKDNFSSYFPIEELEIWINELFDSMPASDDEIEVDICLICAGDPNYRIRLSELTRDYFFQHFPFAHQSMHKFSIINHDTTLVAFDFAQRAYEFIYSQKIKNSSSKDCLSVSLLPILENSDKNLEICCHNFSLAEVLMDLICEIYSPADLSNPESWIRLLLKNRRIGIGNKEKCLVENLITPFHSNINLDEFIKILKNYGYKKNQIEEVMSIEGSFINDREEAIARYVYSLLKRKIQAKKFEPKSSYTDQDFAEFIFRACQSLHTYTELSDILYAQIWLWVEEEGLFSIANTTAEIQLFKFSLVNRNFPFSVLAATLMLKFLIKNSKSFTLRQNTPIFFIEEPFVMRIPIDPIGALRTIKAYLQTGNPDIDTLRAIFDQPIRTKPDCCHSLLYSLLKIEEANLAIEIIPLLEHQDPFICRLGMLMGFTLYSWTNPRLFLMQLPKLIEENPVAFPPLLTLYKKTIDYFKIPPESVRPSFTISGAIKLLCQTSDASLLRFAFFWWKKNINELPVNTGLELIVALSRFDPKSAAFYTNELLNHLNNSALKGEDGPIAAYRLNQVLELFIQITRSFQNFPTTDGIEQLYPIVVLLLDSSLLLMMIDKPAPLNKRYYFFWKMLSHLIKPNILLQLF